MENSLQDRRDSCNILSKRIYTIISVSIGVLVAWMVLSSVIWTTKTAKQLPDFCGRLYLEHREKYDIHEAEMTNGFPLPKYSLFRYQDPSLGYSGQYALPAIVSTPLNKDSDLKEYIPLKRQNSTVTGFASIDSILDRFYQECADNIVNIAKEYHFETETQSGLESTNTPLPKHCYDENLILFVHGHMGDHYEGYYLFDVLLDYLKTHFDLKKDPILSRSHSDDDDMAKKEQTWLKNVQKITDKPDRKRDSIVIPDSLLSSQPSAAGSQENRLGLVRVVDSVDFLSFSDHFHKVFTHVDFTPDQSSTPLGTHAASTNNDKQSIQVLRPSGITLYATEFGEDSSGFSGSIVRAESDLVLTALRQIIFTKTSNALVEDGRFSELTALKGVERSLFDPVLCVFQAGSRTFQVKTDDVAHLRDASSLDIELYCDALFVYYKKRLSLSLLAHSMGGIVSLNALSDIFNDNSFTVDSATETIKSDSKNDSMESSNYSNAPDTSDSEDDMPNQRILQSYYLPWLQYSRKSMHCDCSSSSSTYFSYTFDPLPQKFPPTFDVLSAMKGCSTCKKPKTETFETNLSNEALSDVQKHETIDPNWPVRNIFLWGSPVHQPVASTDPLMNYIYSSIANWIADYTSFVLDLNNIHTSDATISSETAGNSNFLGEISSKTWIHSNSTQLLSSIPIDHSHVHVMPNLQITSLSGTLQDVLIHPGLTLFLKPLADPHLRLEGLPFYRGILTSDLLRFGAGSVPHENYEWCSQIVHPTVNSMLHRLLSSRIHERTSSLLLSEAKKMEKGKDTNTTSEESSSATTSTQGAITSYSQVEAVFHSSIDITPEGSARAAREVQGYLSDLALSFEGGSLELPCAELQQSSAKISSNTTPLVELGEYTSFEFSQELEIDRHETDMSSASYISVYSALPLHTLKICQDVTKDADIWYSVRSTIETAFKDDTMADAILSDFQYLPLTDEDPFENCVELQFDPTFDQRKSQMSSKLHKTAVFPYRLPVYSSENLFRHNVTRYPDAFQRSVSFDSHFYSSEHLLSASMGRVHGEFVMLPLSLLSDSLISTFLPTFSLFAQKKGSETANTIVRNLLTSKKSGLRLSATISRAHIKKYLRVSSSCQGVFQHTPVVTATSVNSVKSKTDMPSVSNDKLPRTLDFSQETIDFRQKEYLSFLAPPLSPHLDKSAVETLATLQTIDNAISHLVHTSLKHRTSTLPVAVFDIVTLSDAAILSGSRKWLVENELSDTGSHSSLRLVSYSTLEYLLSVRRSLTMLLSPSELHDYVERLQPFTLSSSHERPDSRYVERYLIRLTRPVPFVSQSEIETFKDEEYFVTLNFLHTFVANRYQNLDCIMKKVETLIKPFNSKVLTFTRLQFLQNGKILGDVQSFSEQKLDHDIDSLDKPLTNLQSFRFISAIIDSIPLSWVVILLTQVASIFLTKSTAPVVSTVASSTPRRHIELLSTESLNQFIYSRLTAIVTCLACSLIFYWAIKIAIDLYDSLNMRSQVQVLSPRSETSIGLGKQDEMGDLSDSDLDIMDDYEVLAENQQRGMVCPFFIDKLVKPHKALVWNCLIGALCVAVWIKAIGLYFASYVTFYPDNIVRIQVEKRCFALCRLAYTYNALFFVFQREFYVAFLLIVLLFGWKLAFIPRSLGAVLSQLSVRKPLQNASADSKSSCGDALDEHDVKPLLSESPSSRKGQFLDSANQHPTLHLEDAKMVSNVLFLAISCVSPFVLWGIYTLELTLSNPWTFASALTLPFFRAWAKSSLLLFQSILPANAIFPLILLLSLTTYLILKSRRKLRILSGYSLNEEGQKWVEVHHAFLRHSTIVVALTIVLIVSSTSLANLHVFYSPSVCAASVIYSFLIVKLLLNEYILQVALGEQRISNSVFKHAIKYLSPPKPPALRSRNLGDGIEDELNSPSSNVEQVLVPLRAKSSESGVLEKMNLSEHSLSVVVLYLSKFFSIIAWIIPLIIFGLFIYSQQAILSFLQEELSPQADVGASGFILRSFSIFLQNIALLIPTIDWIPGTLLFVAFALLFI